MNDNSKIILWLNLFHVRAGLTSGNKADREPLIREFKNLFKSKNKIRDTFNRILKISSLSDDDLVQIGLLQPTRAVVGDVTNNDQGNYVTFGNLDIAALHGAPDPITLEQYSQHPLGNYTLFIPIRVR